MKKYWLVLPCLIIGVPGCAFMGHVLAEGSGGIAPGGPYLGHRSAEITTRLGLPDKVMKMDDGEAWEYYRCGPQNRPMQISSPEDQCHRWQFAVRDGMIVGEQ